MAAEDHAMTLVPTGTPRYEHGYEFTMSGYWTVDDTLETGDTFTATAILPDRKVTPVRGRVFGVEADTNATPTATLIVGDGTDTNGYLESVTWGGGDREFNAAFDGALMGTTNGASDDIVLTLGGTVATGQTAGKIFVEITYVCSDGARV